MKKEKGAPDVGLEPTTLGLRVPCSTDCNDDAIDGDTKVLYIPFS